MTGAGWTYEMLRYAFSWNEEGAQKALLYVCEETTANPQEKFGKLQLLDTLLFSLLTERDSGDRSSALIFLEEHGPKLVYPYDRNEQAIQKTFSVLENILAMAVEGESAQTSHHHGGLSTINQIGGLASHYTGLKSLYKRGSNKHSDSSDSHGNITSSVTYNFKAQVVSVYTSLLIQLNCIETDPYRVENWVELLYDIIKDTNASSCRMLRFYACEALHELESWYCGLLFPLLGAEWASFHVGVAAAAQSVPPAWSLASFVSEETLHITEAYSRLFFLVFDHFTREVMANYVRQNKPRNSSSASSSMSEVSSVVSDVDGSEPYYMSRRGPTDGYSAYSSRQQDAQSDADSDVESQNIDDFIKADHNDHMAFGIGGEQTAYNGFAPLPPPAQRGNFNPAPNSLVVNGSLGPVPSNFRMQDSASDVDSVKGSSAGGIPRWHEVANAVDTTNLASMEIGPSPRPGHKRERLLSAPRRRASFSDGNFCYRYKLPSYTKKNPKYFNAIRSFTELGGGRKSSKKTIPRRLSRILTRSLSMVLETLPSASAWTKIYFAERLAFFIELLDLQTSVIYHHFAPLLHSSSAALLHALLIVTKTTWAEQQQPDSICQSLLGRLFSCVQDTVLDAFFRGLCVHWLISLSNNSNLAFKLLDRYHELSPRWQDPLELKELKLQFILHCLVKKKKLMQNDVTKNGKTIVPRNLLCVLESLSEFRCAFESNIGADSVDHSTVYSRALGAHAVVFRFLTRVLIIFPDHLEYLNIGTYFCDLLRSYPRLVPSVLTVVRYVPYQVIQYALLKQLGCFVAYSIEPPSKIAQYFGLLFALATVQTPQVEPDYVLNALRRLTGANTISWNLGMKFLAIIRQMLLCHPQSTIYQRMSALLDYMSSSHPCVDVRDRATLMNRILHHVNITGQFTTAPSNQCGGNYLSGDTCYTISFDEIQKSTHFNYLISGSLDASKFVESRMLFESAGGLNRLFQNLDYRRSSPCIFECGVTQCTELEGVSSGMDCDENYNGSRSEGGDQKGRHLTLAMDLNGNFLELNPDDLKVFGLTDTFSNRKTARNSISGILSNSSLSGEKNLKPNDHFKPVFRRGDYHHYHDVGQVLSDRSVVLPRTVTLAGGPVPFLTFFKSLSERRELGVMDRQCAVFVGPQKHPQSWESLWGEDANLKEEMGEGERRCELSNLREYLDQIRPTSIRLPFRLVYIRPRRGDPRSSQAFSRRASNGANILEANAELNAAVSANSAVASGGVLKADDTLAKDNNPEWPDEIFSLEISFAHPENPNFVPIKEVYIPYMSDPGADTKINIDNDEGSTDTSDENEDNVGKVSCPQGIRNQDGFPSVYKLLLKIEVREPQPQIFDVNVAFSDKFGNSYFGALESFALSFQDLFIPVPSRFDPAQVFELFWSEVDDRADERSDCGSRAGGGGVGYHRGGVAKTKLDSDSFHSMVQSTRILFEKRDLIHSRIQALLSPFIVEVDDLRLVPEDFDFEQEERFEKDNYGGEVLSNSKSQASSNAASKDGVSKSLKNSLPFHDQAKDSLSRGLIQPHPNCMQGDYFESQDTDKKQIPSTTCRIVSSEEDPASVQQGGIQAGQNLNQPSQNSQNSSIGAPSKALTSIRDHTSNLSENSRAQSSRDLNLETKCVMIFVPPRYHLALRFTISDNTSVCRIRTDRANLLSYMDRFFWNDFFAWSDQS